MLLYVCICFCHCSRSISEPKNSPALVSGLDIYSVTVCHVCMYIPSQGSGITDYRQEKRDSAVLRSQSVSIIELCTLNIGNAGDPV